MKVSRVQTVKIHLDSKIYQHSPHSTGCMIIYAPPPPPPESEKRRRSGTCARGRVLSHFPVVVEGIVSTGCCLLLGTVLALLPGNGGQSETSLSRLIKSCLDSCLDLLKTIVQPDSMVLPCPGRSHTRRVLFLIGLLEALPVCSMALLVFIYFLSQLRRRPRSASNRLRGGSARQMGSRPVYWTSSNLQGCIVSCRRVLWAPLTSLPGCQSHYEGHCGAGNDGDCGRRALKKSAGWFQVEARSAP